MKTIFYLSILFVTVTMMSSCENEFPFNINNNPPKLVMNALINAESTDNLLFLNFTSKENSTHVQNVTVEVRINGELKESLRPLPPETEGNPQCRFGITSRFTPGDAVRIDAITDDGQYHAWTEINVPQRPFEIENVDTVTVPLAQSGYTTEYLRYRITINDRPNETNYYRIVIDKQTTLWGYNHEEGGDDYIYWTKHSYNFIGREDVVLTDGQPTTGDDEDNGLFDTAKNIYGGSFNLLEHTLPQYGITTTFVDIFNEEEVEAAFQENTKALFIETLGNPNSDVVDVEKYAKIAHAHKVPLVVDNTFATPYLVRPIEYGADIVVHSATKFIGGHGTTIGGVIVDGGKFDWEASGKFPSLTEPNPSYHGISFTKAVGAAAFVTKIRAILLRDTGATISPFHSFLFLQGLETLSLRVERHVQNALKVVEYLNNHPQVEHVNHPSVSTDPEQQELYKKYFPNGGGSIFTFEIKGDAQKAKDFIDNLELFSLLANVADVKSLVIHPATTTHSQCTEEELLDQGIKPNTIRLSIGTENIDDIIQDLDEAFEAVK